MKATFIDILKQAVLLSSNYIAAYSVQLYKSVLLLKNHSSIHQEGGLITMQQSIGTVIQQILPENFPLQYAVFSLFFDIKRIRTRCVNHGLEFAYNIYVLPGVKMLRINVSLKTQAPAVIRIRKKPFKHDLKHQLMIQQGEADALERAFNRIAFGRSLKIWRKLETHQNRPLYIRLDYK
ncbi:MAG: hypothetical protein EXX96DRAFT_536271 [Benjaminiella poitrasii]|nr:MAG: hypothetical protein EXX96DRAFT_536271 [Benjaminiella poitrasii]